MRCVQLNPCLQVGEGTYGEVYCARPQQGGPLVAIKTFKAGKARLLGAACGYCVCAVDGVCVRCEVCAYV